MQASNAALRSALWPALVFISACQTGPSSLSAVGSGDEILNSERIESAFGSFGIDVLSADGDLRVSNLFSEERGERTCRTLAVVSYSTRVHPAVAEAHALIVGGRPIGETFEASGWSIEKHHRYFGEIGEVHNRPRVARLMRLETPASAAVHVYVFVVSRGGQTIEYATIAEVHHPAYLSLNDLESLYGDEVLALSDEQGAVPSVLAIVLRELEED